MIRVEGARVHNLKNIDVEIPHNSLTVITGLSGSGKSSLAFDTIYAEGQRRYLETLSAYSRQFFGTLERPDVDKITGLSPVIAIEQKTTNRNPRSTVGTITEVYDFIRLLYARASIAYSKTTGEQMVRYSDEKIVELIIEKYRGEKIAILAPIIKGRKGHYRELFAGFTKKGYIYARVDGEVVEITPSMQLDRYKIHNIELVIDRLKPSVSDAERIKKSVAEAMKQGRGTLLTIPLDLKVPIAPKYFSRNLMCPTTGIAYNEPAPHTFSFNSPQGACPHCGGLGQESAADIEKIIPDRAKSIRGGAIEPLGKFKQSFVFNKLEALLVRSGYTLDTPINEMEEDDVLAILNGDSSPLRVALASAGNTIMVQWEGVIAYLESQFEDGDKGEKWVAQFAQKRPCSVCGGARLREDSLYFKIDDKNIAEVSSMSIIHLAEWLEGIEQRMSTKQATIAREPLKEIRERLRFLVDVGLGYLSLNRNSATLSGGESQRIRLATQIGSKLVNVLYILDEPSIGLHQRDNIKLINSLRQLRDAGNTVIVVEHDEDMIRAADWIIDVGPLAGRRGGEVSAMGTFSDIIEKQTLTTDYLTGRKAIEIPASRRKGRGEITIVGATGNNLKNVTVDIPLGVFVCVAGVSGSGKSSLINYTLRPALSRYLYNSYDQPLPYKEIRGLDKVDKLVLVDQSPIGRTPRSNPATYSGVWGDIRKLFEATQDAQIRGYKAGRFSFNVKGGRCEECRGAGVQTIEMNFLPDVYVTCKSCNGERYNRDTLQVKYKDRNINDVLNMTVNQSVDFFENIPSIYHKLKAIQDVGLGYLRLGQPCTTLSGGESQRIKLSSELSKRDTGNTLYILDEPTTGLHFEDVRVLLGVLQRLVDRGNSLIVIEHNLDVIKVADHIIDIGYEGGEGGGLVVARGTPEQVSRNKKSSTGRFLLKR
ncbi:Excinuclease ABC subunit A [Mucinivorans hirudinis]|uniref:UvrABC system protein A n=1 Tax=Mucinivorans hirudinis TaxID=1433126 RepID=A0A060R9D6_9BACT|nr:Excinuclease ABC subunit A [Mucinivorans hirudinis]